MCKRYPTLSTLKSTTALPLLAWLTRELDISLGDTRSVRTLSFLLEYGTVP